MKTQPFYTWIYRLSYLYLLIPFVIFCLGWLNIFAGLIFAALAIWATYQVLKLAPGDTQSEAKLPTKKIASTVLVLGLWVLLSGVGGYIFQNWDHHWRNAVFRDLINFKWPVIYPTALAESASSITMLTYYIGFWLPSATVGKILGWEAANASLFLWTWLGVGLVGLLLQSHFKSRSLMPILLLVFFSGMDILGMVFRQSVAPLEYFFFWPPIHRLENWTTLLQYSSNTTQLFWFFNQTVPTWLCISLLLTNKNKKYLTFLWAICVFYAPMQAVGILPFILIAIVKSAQDKNQERFDWKSIIPELRIQFNRVNVLGAGSILILSYFYFSQSIVRNTGEATSFNIVLFAIFWVLEAGILWLLVYPGKRDLQWLVMGVILLISIFLHNDTFDLGERIAGPALFLLMVGIGEQLIHNRKPTARILISVVLVIGAVTTFYEISRSVIKSVEYYATTPAPFERWDNDISATYPIHSSEVSMEEALFHPGTIVADGIKTINTPEHARWTSNYLGEASNSIFYNYFAKKR